MKKYLFLKSPWSCFVAGLVLNLLLLAILEIVPVSHYNLQYPVGEFEENIWGVSSDATGYYMPAFNFVLNGVFGMGFTPDIHRTIGYPALIAVCIKFFGSDWHLALLIIQSVIFALIYPIVFLLVKLLFDDDRRLASLTVAACIFSGAYLCYVHILYTDTLFALLFILGLLFGLRSVITRSFFYGILHVLVIACASQVRPVMVFYPAAFVLLGYAYAKKHNIIKFASTKAMIAVPVLLLVLVSNGPSIRNYINHHVFVSTDVMSNNLFRYLGKRIASDHGLKEQFDNAHDKTIEAQRNLKDFEKIAIQDEFSIPLIIKHPFTTLKWMAGYGLWNSFETHWTAVFNFFDLNWYKHRYKYQLSYANQVLCIVFAALYLLVYILFSVYIFRLLKRGEWALVAGFFFMMMPLFASFTGGGGARMRLSVEWFIIAAALSVLSERFLTKDKAGSV